MDGITQIIADVQQEYNGEKKNFITGFEAGAHTVWQFVFQHPERLKAAAPVAGNYNRNSCMTEEGFSKDAARLICLYKNITETIIPRKAHVPLPAEVLSWFLSISKE